MGIAERVKTWWKTRTTGEKVTYIFGTVSMIFCARGIHEMRSLKEETIKAVEEMEVHVNLVPKDENEPEYYDKAKALWDDLQQRPELWEDASNKTDSALQKSLNLVWETATREGRTDDCGEKVPTQLFD